MKKGRVSALAMFKTKKEGNEDMPVINGGPVSPKVKKAKRHSTPTMQAAISGVVQKIKGSARRLSKSELREAKVVSLKDKKERHSIATGSEWDVTLKPGKSRSPSMDKNLKFTNPAELCSTPPPPLPPRNGVVVKSNSFQIKGSLSAPTSFDSNKKRRNSSVPEELVRGSGKRASSVREVDLQRSNSRAQNVEERPRKRRKTREEEAPTAAKRRQSALHSSAESPWAGTNLDQSEESNTSLPYMFDSHLEAAKLFECIIHPVKPEKFFNELFEKKPLLVKRHMPAYNDGWFSTAELDKILRQNDIQFSVNLDVTTYENGKRETHNPAGRAHASVVWDYFQNGCSVRMLNPQSYSKNVWKLLSVLQEYFNSFCGANVYLTPAGTQGFAPHYDDIEAFILQLEGKKHWRLYNPRSDAEALPRYSSDNFSEDEIGEPILDVVLEAGDLLYFPRGIIHQGNALEDTHSLHITLSTCQKNTWGDLLEKVVPGALQVAFEEDIEFRRALPRNYLNFMGVANSDQDCPERQAFLRKIEQLMRKLVSYAPVDSAVDQMGKNFMHDCLPPVLTEAEKQRSIFGNGEHWDPDQKAVVGRVELEPDTQIKLIRGSILRLVTEEDRVCIYHCIENSRTYHTSELQSIDIGPEAAGAVEYLLHSYPNFVAVESLPLPDQQSQMEVVSMLYDKGLIITQEPLQPLSDPSDED